MPRYRFVVGLALFLVALPAVPGAVDAHQPPFDEPFLLADAIPGPEGSTVRLLLPSSKAATFFLERAGAPFPGSATLWRTDGTPSGTFLIQPDELTFSTPAPPVWWTERFVYFEGVDRSSGARSIWRTDGSMAGTRKLTDGLGFGGAAAGLGGGGALVFLAQRQTGDPMPDGLELWVTDGTPSGTRKLRAFSLPGSAVASRFLEHRGAVYFLGADPSQTGIALWRTDGTAQGTRVVALPPGASFLHLWRTESGLHLVARDGLDFNLSLWFSDGTPAGTRQIASFGQQADFGAFVTLFGELGDGRTLWTVATKGTAPSLWVSDGRDDGTYPVLELPADDLGAPGIGSPGLLLDRRVYFDLDDGAHGLELWVTDGTTEGTEIAFETIPGSESDLLGLSGSLQGHLLLRRNRPETGVEPWLSDGTAAGTRLLADLCSGPCSSDPFRFITAGGHVLFLADDPDGLLQVWSSDLTPAGTRPVTDFPAGVGRDGAQTLLLGDRLLLVADDGVHGPELWALAVPRTDPLPPAGPWLAPISVPGFELKVRITAGGGTSSSGALEPSCIPETACFSGAVPGRSEVFARVVGPKPNGFLWPTLVKFSTSQVEVWVRQQASGVVRYYLLPGAAPGFDLLPGLFDRTGFEPVGVGFEAAAVALSAGHHPQPPPDEPFHSGEFPDFRFHVRIVNQSGGSQPVRKDASCIEETVCLSGAVPGRSEIFLRIVGPKPNGRLWPTLVKFTTSEVEVWIEQISTGEVRYYRLEGAAPGRDELTGMFDRDGFAP